MHVNSVVVLSVTLDQKLFELLNKAILDVQGRSKVASLLIVNMTEHNLKLMLVHG